jgi:beta-N-acetylhexosaminidase
VTRDTSAILRAAAGQLLSVGFEGTVAPAELLGRIGRSEVGGVMLFRPNVAEPAQVAVLVRALREAAGAGAPPLVVSADQEGGAVQRVRRPLTEWPDMLSVGSAGDLARTEAVGRALGSELAALGVAWDLAPVLDVHTNPTNPVIGNRAFGRTPETAAAQALAFWRGLRAAGVLGCGKHFPGHGDTHTDSHHELPVVAHDPARLRAVELAPFAAAAAAGMEAIMTAHVMFPALDPAHPATLSRPILSGVLRGELGFTGLVVSDDLGMNAVAARWPIEELVVESLLAGVDHFLTREPAARQVAAWEALVRAGEARTEVRARLYESAARVARFKALSTLPLPDPQSLAGRVGTPEHQALAASFARVDATGPEGSPVGD